MNIGWWAMSPIPNSLLFFFFFFLLDSSHSLNALTRVEIFYQIIYLYMQWNWKSLEEPNHLTNRNSKFSFTICASQTTNFTSWCGFSLTSRIAMGLQLYFPIFHDSGPKTIFFLFLSPWNGPPQLQPIFTQSRLLGNVQVQFI